MTNPFASADTVEQLIYLTVGRASVCWVGGTGDRVFDDLAARETAEEALARLKELQA